MAAATSLRATLSRHLQASGHAALPNGAATAVTSGPAALDMRSAFFLLNPDGDLKDTQAAFQQLFEQRLGLKVRLQLVLSTIAACIAIVFESSSDVQEASCQAVGKS